MTPAETRDTTTNRITRNLSSGRAREPSSPHPPGLGSEPMSRSYDDGSDLYGFPTNISYQNASNADQRKDRIDGGFDSMSGHHRVRSWSGAAAPAYYFGPPMTGYSMSPTGSGVLPYGGTSFVLPLQQQQLPPSHQYAGSRRKRKAGTHRRVQSDNMSFAATGASPGESVGPPPTSIRSGADKFSPKQEFMKLTGRFRSLSPVQSQRSQSRSPPRGWSNQGAPPSTQSSVRAINGSSIYSSITTYADSGRGVYGMNSAEGMGGMPGYMTLSTTRGDSSNGGEAVFVAMKKGGKHKRTQSNRRMHMRQKSAQLFMEDIKGQEQIPSCRDIIFLMLFVFHVLGIIYLGNTYGHDAVRLRDDGADDDSPFTIIYQNLVFVCLLSGVFGILLSGVMLLLMIAVAKRIVQIALFLSIGLSFVWGTMGIGLSPHKVVPATGIIALALTVAYTIVVWERCKFHGANLYASLTGIRANPGAFLVAFCFQFLALVWSIYFMFVAIGVYDAVETGEIVLNSKTANILIFMALGVSYYWTMEVLLNIVQVTVAGVIGSWWFTPDGDSSTVGEDLRRSFFRSLFYSIGSICFGSLVIGPVRILKQLSALFRPSDDYNSLLCFHECINCIQTCLTSCVDNLADRFNPFALTYVGLYGYNLTDAGLHATELFEKRGWTKIVSDDLVPNVLLMTCLVIAGVTGCFAHILDNMESLQLTSLNEPLLVSFIAGALVGFVVSSVLFGIISSSVNAVMVCFASSPVDFHTSHPELSAEMRSAWREVWPGCMDVVDLRIGAANYLDSSRGIREEETFLIP